MKYKKIVS